ncbi:MAG: orotate phosphoribosyltransferase [Bacillota bacterium]
MTADEAIEIYRDTGVLMDGHFLLTSGKHSPRFLQCSQVLQHPETTARLAAALAELFAGERVETVIGPAMGGVILAYETARALGARAIYAEKNDGGGFMLRRGFTIRPRERVLLVEDAVTTGGSVKRVLDLVVELGAVPVGIGALVDRSGGQVDLGVPLRAVATLSVEAYDPAECPLCKAGVPLTRPKAAG